MSAIEIIPGTTYTVRGRLYWAADMVEHIRVVDARDGRVSRVYSTGERRWCDCGRKTCCDHRLVAAKLMEDW